VVVRAAFDYWLCRERYHRLLWELSRIFSAQSEDGLDELLPEARRDMRQHGEHGDARASGVAALWLARFDRGHDRLGDSVGWTKLWPGGCLRDSGELVGVERDLRGISGAERGPRRSLGLGEDGRVGPAGLDDSNRDAPGAELDPE